MAQEPRQPDREEQNPGPPKLAWCGVTGDPVAEQNVFKRKAWTAKGITVRCQAESLRDILYRRYFVGEGADGWYVGSEVGGVLSNPFGPLPSEEAAKQNAQEREWN
jgi:hypothetical protein